jgi:hypothetical protein
MTSWCWLPSRIQCAMKSALWRPSGPRTRMLSRSTFSLVFSLSFSWRQQAAFWFNFSVRQVGVMNPNEVLQWTPSTSPTGTHRLASSTHRDPPHLAACFTVFFPGKYLLYNHAKIEVSGGVVTVAADMILQNTSSLQIAAGATLQYPQTSPGQWTLYTLDESSVTFDHCGMESGGYIVAPTLCGASSLSLVEVTLANSKDSLSGYLAPFLREHSSLSLSGGHGSKHPLEISLNDQSSASVTNVSSSKMAVSTIVTFDDLVTSGVITGLDPSKQVTQTYRFTTKTTGVNLTFTIVNSQVCGHCRYSLSLFVSFSLSLSLFSLDQSFSLYFAFHSSSFRLHLDFGYKTAPMSNLRIRRSNSSQ